MIAEKKPPNGRGSGGEASGKDARRAPRHNRPDGQKRAARLLARQDPGQAHISDRNRGQALSGDSVSGFERPDQSLRLEARQRADDGVGVGRRPRFSRDLHDNASRVPLSHRQRAAAEKWTWAKMRLSRRSRYSISASEARPFRYPFDDRTLDLACEFVPRYSLRAYDAVQPAACPFLLRLSARDDLTFVSADRQVESLGVQQQRLLLPRGRAAARKTRGAARHCRQWGEWTFGMADVQDGHNTRMKLQESRLARRTGFSSLRAAKPAASKSRRRS